MSETDSPVIPGGSPAVSEPRSAVSFSSIKDSFRQWRSGTPPEESEYRLLCSIPILQPASLQDVLRHRHQGVRAQGRTVDPNYANTPTEPSPLSATSYPDAFELSAAPGLPPTPHPIRTVKKSRSISRFRAKKEISINTLDLDIPPLPRILDRPSTAISSKFPKDVFQYKQPSIQRDPYAGSRKWSTADVFLSGKQRIIHEMTITRYLPHSDSHRGIVLDIPEPVQHNLVMLHGYGAGLGYYIKNFEPLSRRPGWRVHALDLLGMGLSSRPAFKHGNRKLKSRAEKVAAAEDWFVDAIEEWRQIKGVKTFTLIAHSMGGYLATVYCLKYPGRVNKLILISPVGFPDSSQSLFQDFPTDRRHRDSVFDPSLMIGAGAGSCADMSSASSNCSSNLGNYAPSMVSTAPTTNRGRVPIKADNNSIGVKPANIFIRMLWDSNFSPFDFIRGMGPVGPLMMQPWSQRRFTLLNNPALSKLMHEYAYEVFRQPGSGEYALGYLLAPNAWARMPLIHRIDLLGWQPLSSADRLAILGTGSSLGPIDSESPLPAHVTEDYSSESGVPVVFLFGDQDWMVSSGAEKAVRRLTQLAKTRLPATSRRADVVSTLGYTPAKLFVVKDAGHHTYLDGAAEFNTIALDELIDVERRQAQYEATNPTEEYYPSVPRTIRVL